MKKAGMLIVVLVLIALGLFFYLRQPKLTVLQIQQGGEGSVTVTGEDVNSMRLDVSLPHPGVVVIPVETVFASKDPGTQTMIAARTVQVSITTPNQPQSINLEVYCINRTLDAPTSFSGYTVVEGGEELDPVRKLATFLENSKADHYTRQLAIWLMSENHLNMTPAQMRDLLYKHDVELVQRLSSSNASLQELERSFPSMPEEQITKLQQAVQGMKDQLRAYLQGRTITPDDVDEIAQVFNLTTDQAARIKATLGNGGDVVEVLVQEIMTAQFAPTFAKAIDEEIHLYQTSTRDLLREYDPSLMNSTFFNT
jgi:hypothetical protein